MDSPLRVLLLMTGLLFSCSRMGTKTLGSTSCLVVVEGFAVPQPPPRTIYYNRIPTAATSGTRATYITQRASSSAVYLTAATTARGGGDEDGGEGTEATAVETTPRRVLDTTAIIKYLTAITIQMSCFLTFFTGLDFVLATGHISQHQIPFIQVWNFLLFYAFSLKSRYVTHELKTQNYYCVEFNFLFSLVPTQFDFFLSLFICLYSAFPFSFLFPFLSFFHPLFTL